MNIAELARKLRVNVQELRDKLPALGFDIGQKAIKVDNQLAQKIVRAWHEHQMRETEKARYLKITQKETADGRVSDKKAQIPSVLTVRDLSEILKLPVSVVISELMKSGVMASLNQRIDFDTAAILAADLGYEAQEVKSDQLAEVDRGKKLKDTLEAEGADLLPRPPIIVVMGHVDHGKTRLLDAIRKTNVMEGEAGGITQHIGAYQIVKKDRLLTFIDTPGHEAFTAMRSRGARVADIAILVVAATEGVKPQTIEALKIAQEAELPIIVALNKIDLPESNPDKVKQDLAAHNLLAEEWGGKTIYVPISAKFGQNIDVLLDNVLLLADLNADKIRANPAGEFVGSIVESHVDQGEGAVATVLVQNGTLRVGDYVTVDNVLYGRIRSLRDYKNNSLTSAVPSTPAKIIGLKVAPKVGDLLQATDNPRSAKKARVYAMQKQDETFIKAQTEEGVEPLVKFNMILRADVLGSQEAIVESLRKIETPEMKISIVSKGLGSVNEGDVLSAEATGSQIFGFNVMLSSSANALARDKNVVIKNYKIIYELLDEVKKQMRALLKPQMAREDMGKLTVLALFKKTNDAQIIGGRVLSGRIAPNAKAAVLRHNEFVTGGKITELQIGKQIVTDAVTGQECGLKFVGSPLIEVGDVLDIYKETEIVKKI